MTNNLPDVDIDFFDVEKILSLVPHVKASISQKNNMVKHQSGIYLCDIPKHPLEDFSSIDYKDAETIGYQKIDFLISHTYEKVKSEEHLEELMNKKPVWEILHDADILDMLPHLSGHLYAIQKINPKSVEELAMTIAIIRPAKRYLLLCSMDKIKEDIWKKSDGYHFKKSHSIAYAMSIVVSMNLLVE